MRIAFRADASRRIGSGHVMRCATLAGFLRARGAEVVFVCRELEGNYCDWLEAQGIAVIRLPAPTADEAVDSRLAHATWLGVKQSRDGRETLDALDGMKWDWMIVDHYGLDSEWESLMRLSVGRIMVIDDLADRPHNANLLLDQNLQRCAGRYDNLVPQSCKQLLGPRYALLRPEFALERKRLTERTGTLNHLLVFMGGTDPENVTMRALVGVRESGLPLKLDVVLGRSAEHLLEVAAYCRAADNCQLHVQTKEMASLMASADLMIGAPASSAWERSALALPAILIAFAENQRELGALLAQRRAAIYLGESSSPDLPFKIGRLLAHLAARSSLVKRLSVRTGRFVDGKGMERVSQAIFANTVD